MPLPFNLLMKSCYSIKTYLFLLYKVLLVEHLFLSIFFDLNRMGLGQLNEEAWVGMEGKDIFILNILTFRPKFWIIHLKAKVFDSLFSPYHHKKKLHQAFRLLFDVYANKHLLFIRLSVSISLFFLAKRVLSILFIRDYCWSITYL